MAEHVRALLTAIGEDPKREGLLKTPERYARALKYLTSGYEVNAEELLKKALFKEDYDEMVVVKNIEFYSLCEHHLVPFYGKAHVGYIPNGKIVGLSKIARLVNVFARRLQVQERMTKQIGEQLQNILKPVGVGVVIEAMHLCMMMRGVEKENCITVTSKMTGQFRSDEKTRAEFMKLIGK
ncbi:MAG: GTP cyclohydrolase I FolE [Bdellovibrionales bacterium]